MGLADGVCVENSGYGLRKLFHGTFKFPKECVYIINILLNTEPTYLKRNKEKEGGNGKHSHFPTYVFLKSKMAIILICLLPAEVLAIQGHLLTIASMTGRPPMTTNNF